MAFRSSSSSSKMALLATMAMSALAGTGKAIKKAVAPIGGSRIRTRQSSGGRNWPAHAKRSTTAAALKRASRKRRNIRKNPRGAR